MSGTEETVHRKIRRRDQRPQGRLRPFEQAQHREIGDAPVGGFQNTGRRTRCGGLEPDTEENYLGIRVLRSQFHGFHGGVDGLDLCPQRPAAQKGITPHRAGDPQQIAVAGQNNTGLAAKLQDGVNGTGGCHADRASRAGQQLHPRGKCTAQPGLGNGHGVGAANLHQAQGTGLFSQFMNRRQQTGRPFRAAKGIFKEHRWPPGCRQGFLLPAAASASGWQSRHGP